MADAGGCQPLDLNRVLRVRVPSAGLFILDCEGGIVDNIDTLLRSQGSPLRFDLLPRHDNRGTFI